MVKGTHILFSQMKHSTFQNFIKFNSDIEHWKLFYRADAPVMGHTWESVFIDEIGK